MVAKISNSDRRKALRAFKQRGIVVHVGALEELFAAFNDLEDSDLPEFLDSVFDFLSRPDGTRDGILTAELAASIGQRLQRDTDRKDGVAAASVEVIDSFTVPRWRPQAVAASTMGSAGRRVSAPQKPIVDATANAKGDMFRSRYELMLSKTLRNEKFTPPASSMLSNSKKSPYLQLTGVESLAGSKEDKLVLGMLTQLEEGSWFIEDLNGSVRVDLSQAHVTAGFHTESSFVIAQGRLLEMEKGDPIFQVFAMGTPPLERRENSLLALGKDANLFGGQFEPAETGALLQLEKEAIDSMFLLVSDVALDNPRVMAGLRHIFEGYLEDQVVPTVIVFMGNFLSHPFGQKAGDVMTLSEKFTELGQMIATDFAPLAESSTFVIVPGTNDPGPGNVLPRPPMPKMITRGLVEAIGADRVHLGTNPCRIRYMTQELILLRDDMMQKMIRHCSVKPDLGESGLMSEHLIKSLVDQAHLSPLPTSARPVLWNHDHALWLFPVPHTIVLADKVDGYICMYGGTLGLNPGSFTTDFSFSVYLPAERRAQQCSLDSEDIDGQNPLLDSGSKPEQEPGVLDVTQSPLPGQRPPSDDEDERMLDAENDGDSLAGEDNTRQDEPAVEEMLSGPESSNAGSDIDHEEESSDDESMLVPAAGLERRDIKGLIRASTTEDDSGIAPPTTGDHDESMPPP